MTRESGLPRFDNPPVVEVALAVAFEPLPGLTNLALVELWRETFKERFARAEERPPYEAPIERFGRPTGAGLSLSASTGPPPTRYWFVADRGSELIQMQRNWFARNWRKTGDGDSYPRYERHIRPSFESDLRGFISAVDQAGLGSVVPTQCEVTYINHIGTAGLWSDHADAHRVFKSIGSLDDGHRAESVAQRSTHIIASEGDESSEIGRLHIQIDSAFSHPTGEPIFIYNLTARGAPVPNRDFEGVMRFLDIGRKQVVTRFAASTTPEAHDAWRRVE